MTRCQVLLLQVTTTNHHLQLTSVEIQAFLVTLNDSECSTWRHRFITQFFVILCKNKKKTTVVGLMSISTTTSSPSPPQARTMANLTLQTLPDEVFELVIKHAVKYHDGQVPFESWYLTAVSRRFREVILHLVTHVTLSTSMAVSPTGIGAPTQLLSAPLLRCRRLRHLDIHGCDGLNDAIVGRFLRSGPRLRSFCATICLRQTAGVLDDLFARAGPSLQAIELWGCERSRHISSTATTAIIPAHAIFHPCAALFDSAIHRLTKLCLDLRTLTLYKALSLTDASLRSIATLRRLSCLKLRRLTGITDEGMVYIAHGNARLRNLSLQSCATLTDASLNTLAQGRAMRNLNSLTLSYNPRFTTVALARLVSALRNLSDVRCDQCAGVTEGWGGGVAESDQKQQGNIQHITFRGPSVMLSPMTAAGLARLGGTLLSTLDISLVPSVDAAVLRAVRRVAPMIKLLVLHACTRVDDEAALELAQFKALISLDMSYCPALSTSGIATMMKDRRFAQRLNTLVIGPMCHDDGRVNTIEGLSEIVPYCRMLQRLSVCGDVEDITLLWLKQNCIADIEVAHLVFHNHNQQLVSPDFNNVDSGTSGCNVTSSTVITDQ